MQNFFIEKCNVGFAFYTLYHPICLLQHCKPVTLPYYGRTASNL